MRFLPIITFGKLPMVAALGLFVLLTACSSKQAPPKGAGGQPPTIVDVIVAAPQSVNGSLEVNGEIVPDEFVELHPEVSGRLVYLNVPEGANIAQGTVIARINDADLQAQVNKTKVQLELARQSEGRLKKLLDINGLNQADYDVALGQLRALEADLSYTQALIDKTVIKAPFPGRLGLRNVSPGAYVTPATAIVSLQQVDHCKLDFSVPEAYGEAFRQGDTVQFTTNFSLSERQKAIVVAVEPQMDRDTRNIKVRAAVVGNQSQAGAFATVLVKESGASQSIMVPTNAVIPDAMSKKVVTVKGGKAVFVVVETGERQDRLIAIKSGLAAGDTVVVNGVLFTRPNAPVQVREVKQLESTEAK